MNCLPLIFMSFCLLSVATRGHSGRFSNSVRLRTSQTSWILYFNTQEEENIWNLFILKDNIYTKAESSLSHAVQRLCCQLQLLIRGVSNVTGTVWWCFKQTDGGNDAAHHTRAGGEEEERVSVLSACCYGNHLRVLGCCCCCWDLSPTSLPPENWWTKTERYRWR